MRILSAALLILSGASVYSALSETPAFDHGSREATVLGDWRVAANAAMYDAGTYHFQRGYGFLAADAILSADTEGRNEIASEETAQDRVLAARDALVTSVNLDPANAHTWASLAWAHARLADDEIAIGALKNSWALAPYNHTLANTRLALIGSLTMPGVVSIELSDNNIEAIERDFHALNHFDKRAFNFHTQSLPHLAEVYAVSIPAALTTR